MTKKKSIKLASPKLASIPQTRANDPSTQRLYDAVKEVIETVRGTRGDPLDRAIFLRDLVATGLLDYTDGSISGGPGIPGDIGDIDGSDDTTVPPALENIVATAGFSYVLLSWNDPRFRRLRYYEIWRKTVSQFFTVDDNDDFAQRARITPSEISEMEGLFLLASPTPGEIRLRTAYDALLAETHVYNPFYAAYLADPSNTAKKDALLAAATPLKTKRIAVEAAKGDTTVGAVRVGTTVAPVFSDAVDRGSSYLYWVRAVSTAGIPGPFNANGVLATTQPDIEAIMRELTDQINNSLIADFILNGLDMSQYVGFGETATLGDKLVQQQAWIDNLNAGWGVRIELTADGKPYAVGFGINVDASDPNDPQSTFLIRADRFAIIDPDNDENTVAPFIVDDNKVYIDAAFINRASITELIAGFVVADYIRAGAGITAAHINGSTINYGTFEQLDPDDPTSWTYNPSTGRQGNFSVDPNGIMHARYANLRGVLIRDDDDNIVLDTITGTYGSALVSTGNPISASNVGTFISRLAVNTLHIAGNAVTVPASAVSNTEVTLNNSYQSLVSVTFDVPETGEVLIDEEVPVVINWAVESDGQAANPKSRRFRIRRIDVDDTVVVYETAAAMRDVDQYSSGVVLTTVKAGVDTTWVLEGKGAQANKVYQSSLIVTATRR